MQYISDDRHLRQSQIICYIVSVKSIKTQYLAFHFASEEKQNFYRVQLNTMRLLNRQCPTFILGIIECHECSAVGLVHKFCGPLQYTEQITQMPCQVIMQNYNPLYMMGTRACSEVLQTISPSKLKPVTFEQITLQGDGNWQQPQKRHHKDSFL